jgi:hypothetical protein
MRVVLIQLLKNPKGAPCMLTLSRKQMTVLFLILVSFIVALVASMALLHAANPAIWHQVDQLLPDVLTHY